MASNNLATMTMKDQSPNSPLFKLPGELRNRIYELVFENSSDTINTVEAFFPSKASESDTVTQLRKASAAPPSVALLCSCQKIYGESKGIFAKAVRHYWKKEFTVTLDEIEPLKRFFDYVPKDYIKTFVVTTPTSGTTIAKGLLHRAGDRWCVMEVGGDVDDWSTTCWPESGDLGSFAVDSVCHQLAWIVLDWREGLSRHDIRRIGT